MSPKSEILEVVLLKLNFQRNDDYALTLVESGKTKGFRASNSDMWNTKVVKRGINGSLLL